MASSKRTTLQADSSGKTVISAQSMIKLTNGLSGFLRLKEPRRFSVTKSWPMRFAVLGRDTIFIYDSETSGSPRQSLMLLGYKAVVRSTSKDHGWCFSFIPGIDHIKPIYFACTSDRERRTWMAAMKKLLYIANHISEPVSSLLCLKEDDDGDVFYRKVETSVFEPLSFCESDSDGADEAENKISIRDCLGATSDVARPISDGSSTSGSGCELVNDICITKETPTSGVTPKKPSHTVRIKSFPITSIPKLPQPCQGQRNSDYVNTRTDVDDDGYLQPDNWYKPSLYEQCSMVDTGHSREELIDLLKTREAGTYLIRKSRRDDKKVLSFHASADKIVELMIFEIDGCVSLDKETKFNSIEDLLKYYSDVRPVHNDNLFLKRGILCGDDDPDYDKIAM